MGGNLDRRLHSEAFAAEWRIIHKAQATLLTKQEHKDLPDCEMKNHVAIEWVVGARLLHHKREECRRDASKGCKTAALRTLMGRGC